MQEDCLVLFLYNHNYELFWNALWARIYPTFKYFDLVFYPTIKHYQVKAFSYLAPSWNQVCSAETKW